MNPTGPGLEIIPLLAILAATIPVLVHDLTGESSPFEEDPLAVYARWWRRLTRGRRP
ncbi:hypothetical protein NBM05_08310 [Rothia sp. AR01]|uniref:Uncharacterized protein n=1 Tax=Rothia santali TaxID=2949643 RepID=A0A9X2HJF5_9MICC|nr:hypothetical protein [Rothia santali]MCP3426003.1 hypothetical protein [Rothia santali]